MEQPQARLAHRRWAWRSCLSLAVALSLPDGVPSAQDGTVRVTRKISETSGDFGGRLDPSDFFGESAAAIGDLDGDGIGELAVGAYGDSEGGGFEGAVWILFLNADGTVRAEQKINELEGGFGGALDLGDSFGTSVAGLGDLDGDGIGDLAVGAYSDDDGDVSQGAVWILFLNADGTVASEQKISATSGGFGGDLDPSDVFGSAVAGLGDLDGDGTQDLAVGAWGDGDSTFSGTNNGAVWILFMNPDGTVGSEQKINELEGGFGGVLDRGDLFGVSLAAPGDLDRDGVVDLVVGASNDDDGNGDQGALWVLFLEPDGTVASEQKISELSGGFGGDLLPFDHFGSDVAALGDLDGDGIGDLAVGAYAGGEGPNFRPGAAWILFLNADGTVASEQKIAEGVGGFAGDLDPVDEFGRAVAALGDLDGDGIVELAVGAPHDADGGSSQGAVWVLFLEGCPALDFETEDDFETALVNGQHLDLEFGRLVALAGSGANAGLAIFDSTPGGPNDPSQDRDLLVDTGNVLILQTENYPPDADDIFPRPNDDDDGGTIAFAFSIEVEARSVTLIDLDSGDGPTRVAPSDASGRRRTYLVPGNWTGDLSLGQPGAGTLDLTTLAPQPGFGSTATASEDAGFAPLEVRALEVELDGSGALDDLAVCPSGPWRASAVPRAGSGTNPSVLRALSRPVLGTNWTVELDCSALGGGVATLELRRAPVAGTMTPFGEVLVSGALVHGASRAYSSSPSSFAIPVPPSVSLCGLELHAQGLCQAGATAVWKTRAARSTLTNALDLVLGF